MHCRREYNALVKSTAGEVAELKAVQQKAMAEQMKLDEASLQRLEAEKEAAKVSLCSLCLLPAIKLSVFIAHTPEGQSVEPSGQFTSSYQVWIGCNKK